MVKENVNTLVFPCGQLGRMKGQTTLFCVWTPMWPDSLCIIEKAKAPVMRNTGGFVVLCQSLCYTGTAALLRSPSRGKEVNPMENLITFFQTVAAEVVAYYLCKWLDSLMCKGSKH